MSKMRKFKMIEPEDVKGCVPACIASVLGRTYASVTKDWQNDFGREGMDVDTMCNYLAHFGCEIVVKHIHTFHHKDFARKEMLTPFAPIHILRTLVVCDREDGHVVVMEADGKLHCPSGTPEDEIRNSYAFTHSRGIWR